MGKEELVLQHRVYVNVHDTSYIVKFVRQIFQQSRRICIIIFWQSILIVVLVLLASVVHAQQNEKKMNQLKEQKILKNPQQIPRLFKGKKITVEQIPDPHWRTDGCVACHKKLPDKKGLHLRHKNTDQTCNTCHSIVSSHDYIHPSSIVPDKSMQKRMAESFRQAINKSNGQITCTTCHDLPMQCKSERFKERGLNPLFFRNGPYKSRSGICYECHDASAYRRLNPHDQISDQGKLLKDRCSLCHQSLDKLKKARSIDEVDFNVKGNLSSMCTGCHPWRPHPGGSMLFARKKKIGLNHLVKPPKDIMRKIETTTLERNIVLPLAPDSGQIFCGTCHNPHEKGVIKTAAAAHGADSETRLRMKSICEGCHDK